MTEQKNKPLLTLIIGAYRHERFIRQAVEGAFAQTYSPLQIILSDDASPDRTFEIMAEMAAAYRGPHEIVLNRNPKNLGLAAHVNRAVQLARGELLVFSAGDDISLPHRVQTSWEAWESTGRKAFGVHGMIINIGESYQPEAGKAWEPAPDQARHFQDGPSVLEGYIRSATPVILGATAAWSRTLFERFGPLPEDVVYEDMALAFRSMLSGGLIFLDQPLILYRLHGNNIHHSESKYVATWKELQADEERIRVSLKRKLVIAKTFRADLEKARALKMMPDSEISRLLDEVGIFERGHAWELSYREAGFFRRLGLLFSRPDRGTQRRKIPARLLYRLPPAWFYYSSRILKNRLRPKSSEAGRRAHGTA
jgi:glycosyltransferase involved in cell wall biosynthesis